MKKINEQDINHILNYCGDIACYENASSSVKDLLEKYEDENGAISKFLEKEDLTISELFSIKYIYKMHENNLLSDIQLDNTLELYRKYLGLKSRIHDDSISFTKKDKLNELFNCIKQSLLDIGVPLNFFQFDFVQIFDMVAQKEIEKNLETHKNIRL